MGSGHVFFEFSKVPLPSGYFFVRKTFPIKLPYGQINIRLKFLSHYSIFSFALSTPRPPRPTFKIMSGKAIGIDLGTTYS